MKRINFCLLTVVLGIVQVVQAQAEVKSLEKLSLEKSAQGITQAMNQGIYFNDILKRAHEYLGYPSKYISEKTNRAFYYYNYPSIFKVLSKKPIKEIGSIYTQYFGTVGDINHQESLFASITSGIRKILSIYAINGYEIDENPLIEIPLPHGTFLENLEFSHTGKWLFLNYLIHDLDRGGAIPSIMIWEIKDNTITPNPVAHLHFDDQFSYAFNNQETLLAVRSNERLLLYSLEELKGNPDYRPIVRDLPYDTVTTLRFNPQGTMILANQIINENEGILSGWPITHTAIAQEPIEIYHGVYFESFAFNHAGTLFAYGSDKEINILPVNNGIVDTTQNPQVINIFFDNFEFSHDDSLFIITKDMNKIRKWTIHKVSRQSVAQISWFQTTVIKPSKWIHSFNNRFGNNLFYIWANEDFPYQVQVFLNPTPTSFSLDQMIFITTLERLWELPLKDVKRSHIGAKAYIQRATTELLTSETMKSFAQPLQDMLSKLLNEIRGKYKLPVEIPFSYKLARQPKGLAAVAALAEGKEVEPGVVRRAGLSWKGKEKAG